MKTPNYLVYPPWVEPFLARPWSELHKMLSDPLGYQHDSQEIETLASYAKNGTLTSEHFQLHPGSRGGGIIVVHSEDRKHCIQTAALSLYADTQIPSPMMELWNLVGRPTLPRVSLVVPRSDYKFRLKLANLAVPRLQQPRGRFTQEYSPILNQYLVFFICCDPFSSDCVAYIVNSCRSLFATDRRIFRFTESIECMEEYKLILDAYPLRPKGVVALTFTGEASDLDLATFLYVSQSFSNTRAIHRSSCHVFAPFIGHPSYLPVLKGRLGR